MLWLPQTYMATFYRKLPPEYIIIHRLTHISVVAMPLQLLLVP